MNISDINNFNEVIKSEKMTLIDFWAPWCTPCIMLGKVLERIKNDFNGINFYKVNVDENRELSKKYGVMSIPTLIIFKEGKELKRSIGFLNEDEIKEFLDI